ncbi:MAG: M23 family metallopeptidase [bacterium]|nr:M23 family metallopeptidase [bacterium]
MKSLSLFNLFFLLLYLSGTAIGLDVEFYREKIFSGKTLVVLIKDKDEKIGNVRGNFLGSEFDFYRAGDGKYFCARGVNIYMKSGKYPFSLDVRCRNGEEEKSEYKIIIEGGKIEKKDKIKIAEENIKDVTKENSDNENIYISLIVRQVTTNRLWRGNFMMPVKGVITSPFYGFRSINNGAKFFHQGLDLACPEGTEVKASNDGEVVLTEKLISRGNTVIINHGQGIFSVYYHLSRIEVKEKDILKKGDLLGLSGMTGISTGPHLHWSIFANGVAVDPADWIDGSIEKFIFED